MLVDQLSKDVDLSGVEIIDPVVALHERVSKFHVALSQITLPSTTRRISSAKSKLFSN